MPLVNMSSYIAVPKGRPKVKPLLSSLSFSVNEPLSMSEPVPVGYEQQLISVSESAGVNVNKSIVNNYFRHWIFFIKETRLVFFQTGKGRSGFFNEVSMEFTVH